MSRRGTVTVKRARQRLGLTALAALIGLYLAILTLSMSDPLGTVRHTVLFVALWLMGLGALGLVARMGRRASPTPGA